MLAITDNIVGAEQLVKGERSRRKSVVDICRCCEHLAGTITSNEKSVNGDMMK